VRAPLKAERYANLESRVADAGIVAKYNFFILEVIKAWIDPHRNGREPSITREKACSWWPGRRSDCGPE